MAAPSPLPALVAVGTGLAALVLAPTFTSGHLLYRDAVSTPRSFVTDGALGIGDQPPRAVPQDWTVAVLGSVVDGGIVVVALTFLALVSAGIGYGLLAHRLVPAGGRVGAVAASVVAIWNPFVAERLLQGHWSLLAGYAALGWIVLIALDLRDSPSSTRWVQLAAVVAVAGLTPSGSLLATIVLATIAVVIVAGDRRDPPASRARPRVRVSALAAVAILGALPWMTAALVGGAPAVSGSAGVSAFGIRAEPGLGTLGTALGLGGIWNADAVPASRTMWWALIATLCLLVVIGIGVGHLATRRTTVDPTVRGLAMLAMVTFVLVAVSATGIGETALTAIVDAVPGAGLFRDTQKFVALLMPLAAVAAAGAVAALRRWVPSGFALAAVGLLVVAPLPDLAWGVGGSVSTVRYPAEWTAVADRIPADAGDVALWPSDTVRRYTFTDTPSLDPAPRLLRADVLQSGELTVDGVEVDRADGRAARVSEILADGGSPAELAAQGVGWVLVENGRPPAELRSAEVVFEGADLILIRIDGAVRVVDASTGARAAAWIAHLVWGSVILVGLLVSVVAAARTTLRRRGTRRRTPR